MAGKDPKSDKERPLVSPLLIFALLIAIAYALFSFFVVNKELVYDPVAVGALPTRYEISPTQISRSTIRTETVPKRSAAYGRDIPGVAPWNGWVRIENADAGRHKVVVYTQNAFDKPVEVEEFSAQISLIGDEKQILPGVAFSQSGVGEYTAEVTLPENGEWEVRGRLKKGREVILIAQKLAPLLSK
ncbi:MAG TPA: hypothetical protein VHP34_06485 [Alphaproteobacteria bacterium]|nr:hypothetical protein [Alphaproteobacteria bacterium]